MIITKNDTIAPNECSAILESIIEMGAPTNFSENDQSTSYYSKDSLLQCDMFAYGVFEQICDRVLRIAEQKFNLNLYVEKAVLVKVVSGNITEEHADSHNMDGTPKDGCSNFVVSAVAYLNDDFTGGDLVFPRISHRHKPEVGNCVIFPSKEPYTHYVESVHSGERICLAMWFSEIV